MIVGIKDGLKLVGITIVTFCAIFVCSMYLNFYLDLVKLGDSVPLDGPIRNFYDAETANVKVICLVAISSLVVTTFVMLVFYIKHYVDIHRKNFGILKALGYSRVKIAKHFWVFGLSVLLGGIIGFICGLLIAPRLYNMESAQKYFLDLSMKIHYELSLYLVIIPSIIFSFISILYAFISLKVPVLELLKGEKKEKEKRYKEDTNKKETTFIHDLKVNILKSKKSLIFFIIFASYCFSSMSQMAFTMKDVASKFVGIVTFLVGILLAFTILIMSITAILTDNKKNIAIMSALGYTKKECGEALLGGYRPLAYLGFIIGTFYQYGILKFMINYVFSSVENSNGTIASYSFDFVAFFITLFLFILSYELLMFIFSEKIKNISIKEIMSE